jgi:carbonic anhydrase/acetyltransferase-like protein (isoleucine patch superfamily)
VNTQNLALPNGKPDVAPDAWVAPDAVLAGPVSVGSGTGIWYTAVLRADSEPITVGAGSNIQDGCVLHTDAGAPLTVGDGVSVGHRAVLHGCAVDDDTLVGMGAIIMNGARIGRGCLVAAGALVVEGVEVPDGMLVAGFPAKVRRPVTGEESAALRANAENYRRLARIHAEAVR